MFNKKKQTKKNISHKMLIFISCSSIPTNKLFKKKNEQKTQINYLACPELCRVELKLFFGEEKKFNLMEIHNKKNNKK